MTEILTDFSASALVAANKANLFDYFEYIGTSSASNVEVHNSTEIKWILTGLSYAFMNNVLHTHFEAKQAGKRIEEILADFRSKNIRYVTWWAEPDVRPTTLGDDLAANGLTYSRGAPGMAADLQTLNEDIPKPSGLTIEPVQDEDTLKKWVQPGLMGFGDTEVREGDICFDLFNGLEFDLPLRLYVASLDGKPVAASQLFIGAGVAGLYWVATVPEVRKQGIGAAISLAPLLDASEMGYRIGILQASPMGEPMYRRLGFQKYGYLSNYIWTNNNNQG